MVAAHLAGIEEKEGIDVMDDGQEIGNVTKHHLQINQGFRAQGNTF